MIAAGYMGCADTAFSQKGPLQPHTPDAQNHRQDIHDRVGVGDWTAHALPFTPYPTLDAYHNHKQKQRSETSPGRLRDQDKWHRWDG
jgi:hypothetical protein